MLTNKFILSDQNTEKRCCMRWQIKSKLYDFSSEPMAHFIERDYAKQDGKRLRSVEEGGCEIRYRSLLLDMPMAQSVPPPKRHRRFFYWF